MLPNEHEEGEKEGEHVVSPVQSPVSAGRSAMPGDAPKGAWIEIKTIKGHRYRYLRWREGGKRRSRYLGKAVAGE